MTDYGDSYALEFLIETGKAQKSVQRVGTVAGRAEEKMGKMVSQSGYLYYALKRIATYSAIFSFFGALVRQIAGIIDLETRLVEVSTLIDKTNQKLVEDFGKVTEALLRLDPHLGTTVELVRGLYEIMSAGITKPVDALKVLTASAKYAKVGLTDLATAASSVTAVVKAYGFAGEQARKITDALFASVREGKYHTDELNDALGKVLPTAAQMNIGIEEVVATLAIMTQRGLDVTEASTSLNRMLLSFLRPIDKAKKMFATLGWQWGRAAFEGIGLVGAMERLDAATGRYSDLLPTIFRRQRALRGGFILTGEGLRDLRGMYNRVTKATMGAGIVTDEFGRVTKTVAAELKAVWAGLQQQFALILEYKSGWTALIRASGDLLRGIVRFLPVIAAATLAWRMFFRIVKSSRLALANTTRALVRVEEQQAAGNRVKKRTIANINREHAANKKAVRGYNKLNAALIIAQLAYMAINGLIQGYIRRTDAAIERMHRQAQATANIRKEMKRLAIAYDDVTGELLDWRKGMRDVADELVVERIRKLYSAMSGYPTLVEGLKRIWRDLGFSVKDSREEIDLMVRLLAGEDLGVEQMQQLRHFLSLAAREWNLNTNAAIKYREELMKNTEVSKKYFEVTQQVRELATSIRTLQDVLKSPIKDLALRFDRDEIDAMMKNLEKIMEGLTVEQKISLREVFGISDRELADLKKRFDAIKAHLKDAWKIVPIERHKQAVIEVENTVENTMSSAIMNIDKAKATVEGFFNMYISEYKQNAVWTKAFAVQHKSAFEMLLAHMDEFDPKLQQFIRNMIALTEKSTSAEGKAKKQLEDLEIRFIRRKEELLSKFREWQNRWNQEEYMNSIERWENEKRKFKDLVDKKIELMQKAGLTAREMAQERLDSERVMREGDLNAEKLMLYEKVLANIEAQRKIIDADGQYHSQRIEAAKKFQTESIKFVEDLETDQVEFVEFLVELVKMYFEELIGSLELTKRKYADTIKFLRGLSRSFSAVTSALRDLISALGVTNDVMTKTLEILDAIGQGAGEVGQQFQMMQAASEVGGFIAKLGKVVGVIGIIISVVTTAVKIFKALFGIKSKAEKEAEAARKEQERIQKAIEATIRSLRYLGNISESTARDINELARQVGRINAVLLSLADIMDDTGINVKNFNKYLKEMTRLLDRMSRGLIDGYEGAQAFGEAFSRMLEYAQETGTEGSKAMSDLIRKVREYGLEIKEITEYVNMNLKRAVEGFIALAKYMAGGLLESFRALLAEFASGIDIESEMLELAEEGADKLARLGFIAIGVFSAMYEAGIPLTQILEQMGSAIDQMMESYAKLHLEVPDYLQDMFEIFEAYRVDPAMFEALEGLISIFQGLNNAAFMTVEMFAAIGEEAKRMYDIFRKGEEEGGLGLSDEAAIRLMYPFLQQAWWYAEQYGLQLPQWMQEAIDMAEGFGLKFEKPAVERQIDLMQQSVEIEGDIHNAIRDGFDRLEGAMSDMGSYQYGLVSAARTGLARIHEGETVLPENLGEAMRAFFTGKTGGAFLGGEGGVGGKPILIQIDGRTFYKAILPYVREGAGYADFEVDGDGVY